MADFDSVLSLSLDLDGAPLTPVKAYALPAERLARYVGAVEELSPELTSVVAVVCTTADGQTMETLVDATSGEHIKFEDPILYTEVAIPSLVEAQFEEGGEWVLSRGTVEGVEAEKSILFGKYAEAIQQDPPGCLATLRRLLQAGPVTSVYSGGGNGKFVASHEGFALRMPSKDIANWQMTNDKGELVDIPRPAVALRVWDATAGDYESIDPLLHGAPATTEEAETWFASIVKKLKASNYVGPDLLNKLATSERTVSVEPEFEVAGSVANKWTDLVLATNL